MQRKPILHLGRLVRLEAHPTARPRPRRLGRSFRSAIGLLGDLGALPVAEIVRDQGFFAPRACAALQQPHRTGEHFEPRPHAA